jgi:hypothetical protein
MALLQPAKAFIQSCVVAGAEMTGKVQRIQLFETLCKPYLTCNLIIQDDNNVINNLRLVGGQPVSIAFTGGAGVMYRATLYIHSLKGEPSRKNLRTITYTFDLVGPQYFGDKANLVQQSFSKIKGTDIIQKVHDQFLSEKLSILVPSSGLIGKENGYVISSTKPFKAINDIRKLLTFDAYSTGSTLHWRDNVGNKFAPMEHLFATMSPTVKFEQRNTWGSDWRNVFGAYNAILEASSTINESGTSVGRGIGAVASAAQSERKVLDIMGNKRTVDQMLGSVGGGAVSGTAASFGSIVNSVTGGHGGSHNYSAFDPTQFPKENLRQTDKSRMYGATIAGGPQLTIKVPIQTGLLCTVGKGILTKLIPPTGDLERGTERGDGLMLVIDLMHEVHGDGNQMSGTTTMRCAKGGVG